MASHPVDKKDTAAVWSAGLRKRALRRATRCHPQYNEAARVADESCTLLDYAILAARTGCFGAAAWVELVPYDHTAFRWAIATRRACCNGTCRRAFPTAAPVIFEEVSGRAQVLAALVAPRLSTQMLVSALLSARGDTSDRRGAARFVRTLLLRGVGPGKLSPDDVLRGMAEHTYAYQPDPRRGSLDWLVRERCGAGSADAPRFLEHVWLAASQPPPEGDPDTLPIWDPLIPLFAGSDPFGERPPTPGSRSPDRALIYARGLITETPGARELLIARFSEMERAWGAIIEAEVGNIETARWMTRAIARRMRLLLGTGLAV